MKIEVNEHINAPVEKVFAVFADIENAAQHISGIEKIEIVSDTKYGKGTQWRETRTMFGQKATEEMTITEFVEEKYYLVEAESHGTHYKTTFTFTQKEQGTDVMMIFEGIPLTTTSKIMNMFSFIMTGATKKALHQDMVDLKRVCENS